MKIHILKVLFLGFVAFGCSDDFLDIVPQGTLSEGTLQGFEEGVEGLLIAAYSTLNGQIGNATDAYNAPASNWTFGDIVSDDAYKGSSGVSDQEGMHLMEIFAVNANVKDVSKKWVTLYEGINRTNIAIRAIEDFEGWEETKKQQRLGEARFLRGHYYFDLKKIYNLIPYVDEAPKSPNELKKISNRDLSSDDLWTKIEEDFLFAASVLPDIQDQAGRATRGAANAYLAKAYIFQGKWAESIDAADLVINSPAGYGLLDNYNDLFLVEFNNSKESIFSIQHSINDGADLNGFNGNMGDRLSNLGGPYPRNYGFHRPSQNLVNAFKTNEQGLPRLDNFNDSDLDHSSDPVDPRLDHAIGREGIPFLDAGEYELSWTRGIDTYGPYSPKKMRVQIGKSENYLTVPPAVTNVLNYHVIRYADLLLWKAEALVEIGDLEGSRSLVNQVRTRARDGGYVMKLDNSGPAGNYLIDIYEDAWVSTEFARQAVRMERRLEMALEGHRFFDLVRWGNPATVLNKYLSEEETKRTYLVGAQFMTGKHEYFPIPQNEIDLSGGFLVQNPGYQ